MRLMSISQRELRCLSFVILLLLSCGIDESIGQDDGSTALPPSAENCNGIYISYDFLSRRKELPHVKNMSAQSWAFNATATVLNGGTQVLKAWKLFIGFQHREILVGASGAILMSGDDFPASVGNGTSLSGSSQLDLETSINTAGDLSQMQVQIQLTGTQFGLKPTTIPMPKTIKLVNDGFKCPQPSIRKRSMWACCKADPSQKSTLVKTKYFARQKGDLTITYDIVQVYDNNYLAQVTMDNNNALGRLDHWNLTWEWARGEFISTMKGAYTHDIDYTGCLYGIAGQYYKSMDFSKVMNCQKNPIIGDLPPQKYNDTEIGKIPYCCRNGTLLPTLMDSSKSKSVFQLQVYKIPPDLNKTALYPPEKWKIVGIMNPDYKCGSPLRVDATLFPDTSGLQANTIAIATWQIVCNIPKSTNKDTHCCVSFSAYYNDSVVPCNTCACGCNNTKKCNPDAAAMLLPSEALLVPFENRSAKTIAWAKIKHFRVPKKLPCGDNCGVSVNWHIVSDHKDGWTARITLFNWMPDSFGNWFVALRFKKASLGYEKVYSFNGTFLPKLNNTIFMQGTEGDNYLIGITNGSNPASDPKVPGKQQSVISFTKKKTPGIRVSKGDGFPYRVFFNGEECSIPTRFPVGSGNQYHIDSLQVMLVIVLTFTINQLLY